MSKGHRLPTISPNFSALDLVDLYVEILETKKTKRKDMKVYNIVGGEALVPRWTRVVCGDTLLIWIGGTRFSYVSDVAISVYAKPQKIKSPQQYEIHGGYLNAARRIVSSIPENLGLYREIIFFGHSLGAATSLIAAIILQEEFAMRNVRGFGFATPRCVCNLLAKITAGYCLSLCGKDDVVPSVNLAKFLGFVNCVDILMKCTPDKVISNKCFPKTIAEAVEQFKHIERMKVPEMKVYLDENKMTKEVDIRLLTPVEEENHKASFIGAIFNHPARRYLKIVTKVEQTDNPTVKYSVKQLAKQYEVHKNELVEETMTPSMRRAENARQRLRANMRKRSREIAKLAARFENGELRNSTPHWRPIETTKIQTSKEKKEAFKRIVKEFDQRVVSNLENVGINIQFDKLAEMKQRIEEENDDEEKQKLENEYTNIKESIKKLDEEIEMDQKEYEEAISVPRFEHIPDEPIPKQTMFRKILKWLVIAGVVVLSPIIIPVVGAVKLFNYALN